MISIQHYETTDIFLGAYLLSHGGALPASAHPEYAAFSGRNRDTTP
ncbi:MAG: hypothetical protein GY702_05655 [Desulfobulbaceae bacterium]|nr:hypothetical protein [Desulfobulbaceae bacterium]